MIQNKKIYEFNHVRIFFIVIFCSITSFLFYVYMALPRNVTISDYEAICTAEVNGKHIDLRRKVQIKREWQELEKRLKAGPHIGYLD